MLFNPDPSKLAQGVLFSKKKKRKKIQVYRTISLNKIYVERASYQKQIGILLNEKLNFRQHIDTTILKVNKAISVIKKLRHSLPQKLLATIYKDFLKPQMDYRDIIYDKPQSESFCEKI